MPDSCTIKEAPYTVVSRETVEQRLADLNHNETSLGQEIHGLHGKGEHRGER